MEVLEDLVRGPRRGGFMKDNGEWEEAVTWKYRRTADRWRELAVLLVKMLNWLLRREEITGSRLRNEGDEVRMLL